MKVLGNIIWHFPFFGFISAIVVYLLGLILTVLIVTAPVGLGLIEFGKFLFWPFGNTMVSKKAIKSLKGEDDNAQKSSVWEKYSTVVMVIYVIFIGIPMFICAIIQTIGLFLTIIGIPAAMVVAKSLGTYLNPVGKVCVNSAVADEIVKRKALESIDVVATQ